MWCAAHVPPIYSFVHKVISRLRDPWQLDWSGQTILVSLSDRSEWPRIVVDDDRDAVAEKKPTEAELPRSASHPRRIGLRAIPTIELFVSRSHRMGDADRGRRYMRSP
jgi:hypothetical protein